MQPTFALDREDRAGSEHLEAVQSPVMTGGPSESPAELAHDARNMVMALWLYCDLLEERGVLASAFTHYGSELRVIAEASRHLVEKLMALDAGMRSAAGAQSASEGPGSFVRSEPIAEQKDRSGPVRFWEPSGGASVANLAAELLANHNLLAAIAGPSIVVTVDVEGGTRPVQMTSEDLTRILINLVKNAAEAMGSRGRIEIELRELAAAGAHDELVVLTIQDDGPGISEKNLEAIFHAGYTTRASRETGKTSWGVHHRGLGLSIVRSIVEAAGGCIHAFNRAPHGARFEIRLPLRERSCQRPAFTRNHDSRTGFIANR